MSNPRGWGEKLGEDLLNELQAQGYVVVEARSCCTGKEAKRCRGGGNSSSSSSSSVVAINMELEGIVDRLAGMYVV